MTDTDFETLKWLLAPIEPGVFLTEYWERKPLVLSRGLGGYYDELLSLSVVDRVLTSHHFFHPSIRQVTAARETAVEEYTFPDGLIDTRRLLKAYSEGSTIILNQLELQVPPLLEFCRGLERELATRMQANTYVTPRNSQGFKPHYDSHDVFVLQIHGSKHWLFYDTPIELPMRGQGFRPEDTEAGAVTREFTLHPGDLLYIPRGLMHDARTTGEDSVHITAGVLATTWSELLLEAVGHAAIGDRDLRRALTPGFARAGAGRAEAAQTLRAMMQRVVDSLDAEALLDQAADDLIGTRVALMENQLEQLVRLDRIGADTRVGPRPKLIYRLRETDEHVVISIFGTELKLPIHTARPLRYALETPSFAVRDLPDDLDAPGKLVLVRRLVREGILRRVGGSDRMD
ncbi:MAG: cupin domain-containing protein [Deltaproteobacteria bacterium]